MSKFWLDSVSGSIMVDPTGNPIDCQDCGCGDHILVPCCPEPVPVILYATITLSQCFSGTFKLVYTPGWDPTTQGCTAFGSGDAWVGKITPNPSGCGCYSGHPYTVLWIICVGGVWQIHMCNNQPIAGGGTENFQSGSPANTTVCDPFHLVFSTDAFGAALNSAFYCDDNHTVCCPAGQPPDAGYDPIIITVTP